jgi:ribosomal protein S12 methylthiotransferase accessory factor
VLPLASSFACVFAVFVQSTTRPFTAVAAAAEFAPEPALDRALHEVEARVLHAAAFPATPLRAASEVTGLEDIPRLYQSPRWYRHADFLAAGPVVQRFATEPPPCRGWAQLPGRLAREGHRLLAFDLTPPHASLRQGRTPLHVMRAVIPGLIPIWFRPGLEPAGLDAYQRAARSPGARAVRRSPAIHPFT